MEIRYDCIQSTSVVASQDIKHVQCRYDNRNNENTVHIDTGRGSSSELPAKHVPSVSSSAIKLRPSMSSILTL